MIKYVLAALVVGVVAGYGSNNIGSLAVNTFVNEYLFNVSLILLLFVMGFVFGVDSRAVGELKKAGLKILLFPFCVAAGSIFGGLVSGFLLNLNLLASMAVASGFGWYTLAGPLVGQMFGSDWGALGFTANFLRELLTIVTVSLTVKIDKHAPVAFGGATTMDTTLPIIVRYCGAETLVIAFVSGFVLSAMAPFLIIAIASLGR